MSGGAFNYSFIRMYEFASALDEKINNNNVPNEFGYADNLSDETLANMKTFLVLMKSCAILSHEIEWLYSGDSGEDQFNELFNKLISANNACSSKN